MHEQPQVLKAIAFEPIPHPKNVVFISNEAFLLSDTDTRALHKKEFLATSSLYYDGQPDFESILDKIQSQMDKL